MKKWLFILPLAFVFGCGEGEKENELVLESFEDKLSFVFGASSAKEMLGNQQISGDKLDKTKLMEGFRANYSNIAPEDCKATMEGLYGMNGTDFNTEFLDDGSMCVGKILSFSLYSDLERFEKLSQVDTMLLFRGFLEGLNGNDTTYLSVEEQVSVNEEFSKSLEAIMQQQMEEMFKINKEEGENFLMENKNKPGVITTPTGLQYEVIKPGSGSSPSPMDEVTVHYHGTLLDGTVFDSSVERGQTIDFNVSGVIPGWTEVLQLMKKGSKFKVYVPQELAYGANPDPRGPIEPYTMLIFEIELINF